MDVIWKDPSQSGPSFPRDEFPTFYTLIIPMVNPLLVIHKLHQGDFAILFNKIQVPTY